MMIWMAIDPETRRVLAQTESISRDHLPPGPRGDNWPVRTLDVNASVYSRMVHGNVTPDTQDKLHRDWWNQARAKGEPEWPLLPGETSWQPSL